MLKIGLIGFGKMGQTINQLILNDKDATVCIALHDENNANGEGYKTDAFLSSDVIIDFSHESIVLKSIETCLQHSIPIVVGTTGWSEHIDQVKLWAEKYQGKVLYGSNFSLGVQLFNKLIGEAAKLFGNSNTFDAGLHENHHNQKVDHPSGTALTIAEQFVKHASTKSKVQSDLKPGKVDAESFVISSNRVGSIFGEHELLISSPWDKISIKHTAMSREGFAAGSIKAAKWLANNDKTGFYLIEDVVQEVLKED